MPLPARGGRRAHAARRAAAEDRRVRDSRAAEVLTIARTAPRCAVRSAFRRKRRCCCSWRGRSACAACSPCSVRSIACRRISRPSSSRGGTNRCCAGFRRLSRATRCTQSASRTAWLITCTRATCLSRSRAASPFPGGAGRRDSARGVRSHSRPGGGQREFPRNARPRRADAAVLACREQAERTVAALLNAPEKLDQMRMRSASFQGEGFWRRAAPDCWSRRRVRLPRNSRAPRAAGEKEAENGTKEGAAPPACCSSCFSPRCI